MTAIVRLAAVAAAVTLAGCTGSPAPEDRYYRLDVAAAAPTTGKPLLAGIVQVASLDADGLLAERPLVYALSGEPFEIRHYNYDLWNEPPGTLVQDQLIRYLRGVNLADRVVSTDLRTTGDYVVEGRVHRFDQVIGAGTAVVVELEFTLIRLSDDRLMLLETYRKATPAANDTAPAAARAANSALAEIFAQFVEDLARVKGRL